MSRASPPPSLDVQNDVIILSAKMVDKTHRNGNPGRIALLSVCILAGFALRMYRLGQQPLAWDEGWSIGLSSLGWAEINRITALDVHPPLYYYLFRLWLVLGRSEAWLRFLSVAAGMAAIPLAYVTGRTWVRSFDPDRPSESVGLWAACIATASPFLIYYAQVARMYALSAALALLCTYCLLKALERPRLGMYLGFLLSAAAAVYTFYYCAPVIVAVLICALWIRPRRWLPITALAAGIGALYVPWLLYAIPPMLTRVGARTGVGSAMVAIVRLFPDAVYGLVFAYGAGWWPVWAAAVLTVGGLFVAWRRRERLRALALPALAIGLTTAAVCAGAQAHMFAARYLIPASVFAVLLLAWASDQFRRSSSWLGVLAALLVAVPAVPTLKNYVYSKSYEVSGSFDPQADYRFLRDKAWGEDVVFFNVLSLAGLYERYRTPYNPNWSYVLRWDPVIEPLEGALAGRVLPAASRHRRLWFVLYKGTVAANRDLKEWLDANLFPAFGEWRGDTLYVQYLSPTTDLARNEPQVAFAKGIQLRTAEYTRRTAADDRVTVRLTWTAAEPIQQSYKVFVHLYASDGRLVTQHDAVPMNELRPTSTWQPGQVITDNHGLWLPADASGVLRLVVGLYDPESNARLELPDGSDRVLLGVVEVAPRAN
jgi:hypothetical protein